jgi:hypothetical protein
VNDAESRRLEKDWQPYLLFGGPRHERILRALGLVTLGLGAAFLIAIVMVVRFGNAWNDLTTCITAAFVTVLVVYYLARWNVHGLRWTAYAGIAVSFAGLGATGFELALRPSYTLSRAVSSALQMLLPLVIILVALRGVTRYEIVSRNNLVRKHRPGGM